MASREYFKGKRVAVVGLGPHGEMVSDVKFLIKAGALVGIYDLRSESMIKNHLVFLRSIGLANYVCGAVPPEDLLDMDLIILSHEYPRNSSFLKLALEKGVPVEYPESLFFGIAPPVTIVGVIGAAGKATVMSMLGSLLEAACAAQDSQGLFIIDPESAGGALAHLKRIKSGDIVLVRMTGLIMKELYQMRMSPHVAVFTSVPSIGTYQDSPFDILSYQTYNNFIVAPDAVIDMIHGFKFQAKAKMFRTKPTFIPDDWPFEGRRYLHDLMSAALSLQAAYLFKLEPDLARNVLEKWKPLKHRLEPLKRVRGVEFYNDAASVASCSTETALESVSDGRNLVLVFGGVEGDCDYRRLYELLPRYVHTVVLLPGSGTMKERRALGSIRDIEVLSAPSLEEAARMALERARKGDKVLFSPGFEAGGMEKSRKERGERFVRAVRTL